MPGQTFENDIIPVLATYYTSVGGTTSPTQTINFDTKVFDSHNSVTASPPGTGAWRFTAPISGYYNVGGSMEILTPHYVDLFKNGVIFANIADTDTNSGMSQPNFDIYLLAGDYIDLRTDVSDTYGGGSITQQATSCKICIKKVG